MKLFLMSEDDTWIGPDLETTKAAYIKECGDDAYTLEVIEDATEYSEADLDRTKVDMSADCDGSDVITARELLAREIAAGGEFPRFAFGADW